MQPAEVGDAALLFPTQNKSVTLPVLFSWSGKSVCDRKSALVRVVTFLFVVRPVATLTVPPICFLPAVAGAELCQGALPRRWPALPWNSTRRSYGMEHLRT